MKTIRLLVVALLLATVVTLLCFSRKTDPEPTLNTIHQTMSGVKPSVNTQPQPDKGLTSLVARTEFPSQQEKSPLNQELLDARLANLIREQGVPPVAAPIDTPRFTVVTKVNDEPYFLYVPWVDTNSLPGKVKVWFYPDTLPPTTQPSVVLDVFKDDKQMVWVFASKVMPKAYWEQASDTNTQAFRRYLATLPKGGGQ